jgi:hypothetical protein
MKRKAIYSILIIEAVICMIVYAFQPTFSSSFLPFFSFPFEQIGWMLRWMSEGGVFGNTIAILMYVSLCTLPVLYLIAARRKRDHSPEDLLLGLLSVMLFVVMYRMINPSVMDYVGGVLFDRKTSMELSGQIIYSILCAYIILRVLRRFYLANINKLQTYLGFLLYALNAMFIFIAAGICFGDFLASVESLHAGNVGNEQGLGLTYAFLFFQYLVNALPHVLSIIVVFSVLSLLQEMSKDRYSVETLSAANKLAQLCGIVLAITVLSGMAHNLIQFIFAKSLYVLKTNIEIPLISIAFFLAILLVTQIICDNSKLKEYNSKFI